MKLKNLGYKHPIYLMFFFVLCLFAYSSSIGIVAGQKQPTSLKLDVNADDSLICSAQGKGYLNGSRFCALYRSYYVHLNNGNLGGAQADRNEMIEIVRGQIDNYYKLRKDGRSSRIRFFHTVLDFLEVGGAAAIAIMKGERAKTITGVAIGALQGGRTSFNRNFEILNTQVLINKMNSNRAQILTEIYGNIDKPVRGKKPSDGYSWYAAKNDLRRYLFAGTFNNALDSLVNETGAEVEIAERQLRRVEKRIIVNEATKEQIDLTNEADEILTIIQGKLAGNDADKQSATEALKKILTELNKTEEFRSFFKERSITVESSGSVIYEALVLLMRDNSDNEDLSQKIENIIIEKGKIE
ncbi:MAG TPA: hypothetical protein VF644_00275 [Pyrinomonadaceae bacterium]|jgi:hypothetical protein